MNAKLYSIGLSLLAALLLVGCGKKVSEAEKFDIPVLLFSKFEQAETTIGKPMGTDFTPGKQGPQRFAVWRRGSKNLLINYSATTQLPQQIIFSESNFNDAGDQTSFLEMGHLSTHDNRYKLEIANHPSDSSRVTSIGITPNTPTP